MMKPGMYQSIGELVVGLGFAVLVSVGGSLALAVTVGWLLTAVASGRFG
jgi:hypothetical protein